MYVFVNKDGKGDLSHFIDIYHVYKQQGVELVPVVCGYPNNIDYIFEQLKEHQISTDYCGLAAAENDGPVHEKKLQISEEMKQKLKRELSEVVQFILVSYGNFTPLLEFESSFNPHAPVKFIGEHESKSTEPGGELKRHKPICYPMGLSDGYGIKIKPNPKQDIPTCQKQIEADNPDFVTALFKHADVPNMEALLEKSYLVTAYYAKLEVFMRLLLLLATNESLADKPIEIYLSTNADADLAQFINKFLAENDKVAQLIKENIKEITVITPKGGKQTIPISETGKNSISVFHGFPLKSTAAYDAMYACSNLVAPSGDNTFEKAISNEKLPIYVSTNMASKIGTIRGLINIIKAQKFDKQVMADFYYFYDNLPIFMTSKNEPRVAEIYEHLKKVDFKAMMANFPAVCKDVPNMYDQFDDIFVSDMKIEPYVKGLQNRLTVMEELSQKLMQIVRSYIKMQQETVDNSQTMISSENIERIVLSTKSIQIVANQLVKDLISLEENQQIKQRIKNINMNSDDSDDNDIDDDNPELKKQIFTSICMLQELCIGFDKLIPLLNEFYAYSLSNFAQNEADSKAAPFRSEMFGKHQIKDFDGLLLELESLFSSLVAKQEKLVPSNQPHVPLH